jgi:uncharacterized protein YjbJ (UPF0337 family)
MTDDRIAGTTKNLGGKFEEGLGRMTGDAKTEFRGKARQAEGAAQDLYGQAQDTAADVGRHAQKAAEDASDVVREFVETRPYTTACLALAVGFLLGRTRSPY